MDPMPVLPPYPHPGLDAPSADFVEVLDPPPIDWVPATPSTAYTLASRAFITGREGWDKSPLWTIRVHRDENLIPGKLAISHGTAYIPFNGKEVSVQEFEVLCAASDVLEWVSTSNDQIPEHALPAGNTHIGEPLYVVPQ
ncbi:unnamed protein product [Leptidea sinapis]|uniref:Uncharacterized protein n=1 Tax=Leptidea sinapis TaxID=189913 RepID=A0A5E4QGH8_9NEOP|nr:unnamed protein product [Leptidea sinapis]